MWKTLNRLRTLIGNLTQNDSEGPTSSMQHLLMCPLCQPAREKVSMQPQMAQLRYIIIYKTYYSFYQYNPEMKETSTREKEDEYNYVYNCAEHIPAYIPMLVQCHGPYSY